MERLSAVRGPFIETATVDEIVYQISFFPIKPFHHSESADRLLDPLQDELDHINGHARRSVVERVLLCISTVTQHRRNVQGGPIQQVFTYYDNGNTSRSEVSSGRLHK